MVLDDAAQVTRNDMGDKGIRWARLNCPKFTGDAA